VLKITVQDEPKIVTLRLEGRIAGSWVAEFDRTWHSLAPSLESKKLCVDLREVSYIDAGGQQILSDICKKAGADFQTDSLWIDWIVQEARQGNHEKGKGEPK
jgi:anti-anti-sigma regulatory factor